MTKAKTKQPKNPIDDLPESFSKIVDIQNVTPEDVKRILAENARLTQELADQTAARTEAEQKLVDQAASQLAQTDIREVPTGRTVNMRMLDAAYVDKHDDGTHTGAPNGYRIVGYKDDAGGRPILKPVFKSVKVPTFYYRIDLPPSGGEALKLNGVPYYHGTIGEFDLHTLRTVKEIVYRGWDHERNISGSNENVYREQKRPHISARAA